METSIGAYLRKLRLTNEELLKDMAKKLEVSSAFLSAVENGKKKVPDNWLEKISSLYSINSDEQTELKNAILESSSVLELDLREVSQHRKEVAISFAREFETMDEEMAKTIMEFLKERGIRKEGG